MACSKSLTALSVFSLIILPFFANSNPFNTKSYASIFSGRLSLIEFKESASTLPTIVATISSAILSCTSKTSSTERSKLLDQIDASLFVEIRLALIRIRLPNFLTLP